MTTILLKIDHLIEGTVVKRPSKFIKTPYVADIIPLDSNSGTILGHTASLGCCGLADEQPMYNIHSFVGFVGNA